MNDMTEANIDGGSSNTGYVDERTLELFGRIKPVRMSVRGLTFNVDIHENELRSVAFNWLGIGSDIYLDLKVIGVFLAKITCGYYGFLKVTYGEVIDQMPPDLLARATAFELPDMEYDVKFIINNEIGGYVHQEVPIIVYDGVTSDEDKEVIFGFHTCRVCGHGLKDHLPSNRENGELKCYKCHKCLSFDKQIEEAV
jgi:hypothetical protein